MKISQRVIRIIKKVFGRYNYIEELKKQGAIIGLNTHILGCTIDPVCPFLISIGDNTTITMSTILTHDASTKKPLGMTKIGRVTIGSNVFIGARSLVLPNVSIGDNCIIGGGSVVTKSIPANSVAVGNPAVVITSYDEYIERMKKLMDGGIAVNHLPAELDEKAKNELRNNLDKIGFIL